MDSVRRWLSAGLRLATRQGHRFPKKKGLPSGEGPSRQARTAGSGLDPGTALETAADLQTGGISFVVEQFGGALVAGADQ